MEILNIKILNHYTKVIYSSRQYWFSSRKPINVTYHIQKLTKKKILDCMHLYRKIISQILVPIHGKKKRKKPSAN